MSEQPGRAHDRSSEGTRLRPESHLEIARGLLLGAGADPQDAQIVAEGIQWADLHGRAENGLVRLVVLVRRLARGLIRSPAQLRWTRQAAAVHLLDADDGFGHVASLRAVERGVDLARQNGIGYVGVRRSNHYGAAGYYCALAAEAGCASINVSNAWPKVAPYGGRRPALGTNPIAFGCPTPYEGPILVDLSTSAVSGAEVRHRDVGHTNLPPSVALDANGNPTADPGAAQDGCLLPAAGPKGFGLGLMVEILSGVLTSAAAASEVGSLFRDWDRPTGVGHAFIVLDIQRFMPMERFAQRVGKLLREVLETPPLDPTRPVRYPGQIRPEMAAVHRRQGIPVAQSTVDKLEELARTLRVSLAWD